MESLRKAEGGGNDPQIRDTTAMPADGLKRRVSVGGAPLVVSEHFCVSLLCWSVANLHFREAGNWGMWEG